MALPTDLQRIEWNVAADPDDLLPRVLAGSESRQRCAVTTKVAG